jgi:short-chain fatty acids transporter
VENPRMPKLSDWLEVYSRGFQRFLPSPFAIALILTAVAFVSACLMGSEGFGDVLKAWSNGLWNPDLMRFGFQAMFMLVLGHILALSPPVSKFLNIVVDLAMRNTRYAAAWVALFALLLGWINWGLGLVAGALLAKSVIDRSRRDNSDVNPGLIGAAGYMGLLVWHSGLSGSAPLKVAEPGHLVSIYPKGANWSYPIEEAISISRTVFTSWNFGITLAVIVSVVLLFIFLGTRVGNDKVGIKSNEDIYDAHKPDSSTEISGSKSFADIIDNGKILAWTFGSVCTGTAIWIAIGSVGSSNTSLGFVTPDWINLFLLGLAMLAHGSISNMLNALERAIGGASGILLQFPIYFGIMGIVTGTGLAEVLSGALVSATTSNTLPLAIFGSSGLLNIFVPSGGGQWAVQGPLVIESCHAMGISLEKGIMAMAYGDQWTNMMQPFWALPLLGITGLKARDILPYTLAAMIVSGLVFMISILLIV